MCQLWVWPSGSSTHRRERSIVIGAWKQISRPSKLTWKILILHITTCMNHIFFPGLVRLNTIFQSYYATMVSDTCQGLRVSPSLPSHEQAISLPLWWKVRSVCVRSCFFFVFHPDSAAVQENQTSKRAGTFYQMGICVMKIVFLNSDFEWHQTAPIFLCHPYR